MTQSHFLNPTNNDIETLRDPRTAATKESPTKADLHTSTQNCKQSNTFEFKSLI